MGYGTPGPIPWSSIQVYCDANGIEGEQREDLFYHVQHLDKSYLDWSDKKRRQDLKNTPKPTRGRRK